jgi:xylan 1,4-beta-xylosidase
VSGPSERFASLPQSRASIDAGAIQGPLEWWRHSLGHGGINPAPLPERVVDGVRRLKPRLIRLFLQEFFQVYPDHGRFDWTRLDPYMEAMARTGAQVVASICIKPPALFPKVDHAIWQPADVAEWQKVIAALVRRYSVERPIVTHWEIGNETDIGESGGTPYLIPDPDAYFAFYRMTIPPILATFPEVKVGGPAACWVENQPLPGLVERCRASGTPLHFVSWHLYSDDPARHASGVEKARQLLADFPGELPEMMVTEWSKSFDPVSVEELAFAPRRAAIVAASILAMLEAGLDWSFYYHIWDQVCDPDSFAPFFSPAGVAGMLRHWNERPHRFGLFGVGEEVRPQYLVYWMLSRLGEERLAAQSDEPEVRILAARNERATAALLVNLGLPASQDRLVTVQLSNPTPGRCHLTTHRIDAGRRWSPEALELLPLERREVYVRRQFQFQLACPADSVTMVALQTID